MGKKNTVRTVDMKLITDDMFAVCASCHKSIVPKLGVCIGRPSFTAPAMNVCLECITVAAGLMLTKPPFGLEVVAKPLSDVSPARLLKEAYAILNAAVARGRKGKRS